MCPQRLCLVDELHLNPFLTSLDTQVYKMESLTTTFNINCLPLHSHVPERL